MADDVRRAGSGVAAAGGAGVVGGAGAVGGPGAITPDGCAVEVYRRLPPDGDPERVHAVAGPGASILDLGCGVGRIADPLVRLGHDVVAVDESAEMLAEVRAATPVLSRIEELDLDRRFDLVLLASHLANTPGRQPRAALFAACRRHLDAGGRLLLEWSTPDWFDHVVEIGGLSGRLEPFALDLEIHGVDRPEGQPVAEATVTYLAGELAWSQRFRTERLTLDSLAGELAEHDLHDPTPLDGAPYWLVARAGAAR